TASNCSRRSFKLRESPYPALRAPHVGLHTPRSAPVMTAHDEDVVGKAYDSRLMRRLLRYLRPYRGSALLALVAIISGSVLQLAQPYLMKVAIDRYIPSGNLSGMNLIAAAYLGIIIASFCLDFTQTWLLQNTGQRIMFDMRAEIYAHLQRLDLRY